MASYGICIGVLAGLNRTIYPVLPSQVKNVAVGRSDASKQEMIDWVIAHHPEIKFPTKKFKGQDLIIHSKAEHMADAVATIYAGLKYVQGYDLKDIL